MDEDQVRLRHIVDAANDALTFSSGRGRADLDVDRLLMHALVRCVEIIGEAANQLSTETRERYPRLPWRDIVGTRNRLVHAYYDINLDVLWTTVMEDLPVVIKVLDQPPDPR